MTSPAPGTSAERLARRYGTRPGTHPGARPAGPHGRPDHRDQPGGPEDPDGAAGGSGPGFGRWVAWIGSALVAVVLTAVVVAINLLGDDAVATAQAVSYEVTSDEAVVVQLAVTRPDPAVAVTCTVEAVDASLAQVGARTVEVPARPGGAHTVTLEVEVATYARAEQGRAVENGCFAIEP